MHADNASTGGVFIGESLGTPGQPSQVQVFQVWGKTLFQNIRYRVIGKEDQEY